MKIAEVPSVYLSWPIRGDGVIRKVDITAEEEIFTNTLEAFLLSIFGYLEMKES